MNSREAITDYLSKRNPQFCYTNILVESVTATRREERKSLVISNCMKQHLLVLKSEQFSLSEEYLFSCKMCFQFDFRNCSNAEEEISEDSNDLDVFDDENAEDDREQQVFEFVEAPFFVTMLTGIQVEPLTEKAATESSLSDICVYMVMLYFQEKKIFKGRYLKIDRIWQFYRVTCICHLMRSTIRT